MKKILVILVLPLIIIFCLKCADYDVVKGNYKITSTKESIDSSYVNGYVVSRIDGKPLPWSNIIIRGTKLGTSANEIGYFRIQVPSGRYSIKASHVGYTEEVTKVINFNENREVTIVFYLGTVIMHNKSTDPGRN